MEIETKYSIGDKVYYMYQNKIYDGTIKSMTIIVHKNKDFNRVIYTVEGRNTITLYPDQMFSSKEELLKNLLL